MGERMTATELAEALWNANEHLLKVKLNRDEFNQIVQRVLLHSGKVKDHHEFCEYQRATATQERDRYRLAWLSARRRANTQKIETGRLLSSPGHDDGCHNFYKLCTRACIERHGQKRRAAALARQDAETAEQRRLRCET